MKWKKYTIQTTTEAEDYISAMLAELGAGGNRKQSPADKSRPSGYVY